MKKLVPLLTICLMLYSTSFGQIYDLSLLEDNYDTNDTVKLKYRYSFASQPCSRDSILVTYKDKTHIDITAYYALGDATSPCGGEDTIDLGKMEENNYVIVLNMIGSFWNETDSDTISFHIERAPKSMQEYLTSLELDKEEYTSNDSIVLNYNYIFPSQPCLKDSVLIKLINDTCLYVDAFYSIGDATSPCGGRDSIILTGLQSDNYTINFDILDADSTYVDGDTLNLTVKSANTSIRDFFGDKILIHPNPAKSEIIIDGINGAISISIVTLNGQTIKSETIANSKQPIDISDLPDGFYLLKVYSKKEFVPIKKLVIRR